MTVGIRELKNRATELVRLVESGKEEITITRHSRPVARLVRAVKPGRGSEREALARLAALGLVRLGNGKFNRKWRPIKGKGRPGSEIIIQEREDRF